MNNSNKNKKILIIVLAVALVGAIVLLGAKSGFIDRVFFNKYVEYKDDGIAIEHQNDKEETEKIQEEIEKENTNQSENNSKGEQKDLGGGLYLNPDGSIETEILP